MSKKNKIILGSLFLAVLLMVTIAILVTALTTTANAAEQPPVQLFVESNPQNTVAEGSITNERFGVILAEAGFVNLRLPNQNTYSRNIEQIHLFNFTLEGTYTIFRFTPRANPMAFINLDITITLDRTAPTINLFENGGAVESGAFVQGGVSASASDSLSGLDIFEVSLNGGAFITYTNELFNVDGVHEFRAVDVAGNESRAVITRDTVAPTLQVLARGVTVKNYAVTTAEKIEIVASDELSGVNGIYVRLPNASTFTRFNESVLQFTQVGRYEIFAVDNSGNESDIFTITIDNVAPTISITHEGIVLENNAFISGNLITFHVDKPCATGFVYNILTGEATTILNSATITEEGSFRFYAVDGAGNISQKITVTIDRTPKVVNTSNVINYHTTQNVQLSWTDKIGFAPIVEVTVNDVPVA